MAPDGGADNNTPADNPHVSKGPLASLAERAVDSSLFRQAQQHIPASALPALQRTKEPANRVITAVDETLSTEEAKRVATAGTDFFHAVAAFTLLILTFAVNQLESTLNITSDKATTHPSTNATDGTAAPRGLDGEAEGTAETVSHSKAAKARELLARYAVVARTAFSKMSNRNGAGCDSISNRSQNPNIAEASEKQCSMDKFATHARAGMKMASQVGAYSLSTASQFKGPGASAIAPAANYVISALPENAQRVVKDSKCPFNCHESTGSHASAETVNADQVHVD